MRIIFVSLLCLILIGITSYSYAQVTGVDSQPKGLKIMLQLELRDSDGNLITYIEAEQIIGINPLGLNEFLDNQKYKKFLIKDGKAYEIIQWQGQTEKLKKHAYSQFDLWKSGQDGFERILTVRHNSYQTQHGDTLTVYWTIVRPAS